MQSSVQVSHTPQMQEKTIMLLSTHLDVTTTILKGKSTIDDGELVHWVMVVTINETDQLEKEIKPNRMHAHT